MDTGATVESSTKALRRHGRALVVAHRGASGLAPENTLVAIEEAARQGADFVEVDVDLTSDGVPVLFHDRTLIRTTNVAEVYPERAEAPVSAFTLAELRKLDAGSWFDDRYAGVRIATLDEALAVLREHGLGLWAELKSPVPNPELVRATVEVLRRAPGDWLGDQARLTVTSFNFDVLAHVVEEVGPDVTVGAIAERVPDDATLGELARWVDFFIPNHRKLRPGDIVRMRAAGLRTAFWTPNDPVSVAALLAQGADGLIQNYPAVVTALLAGRSPFPEPDVIIERLAGPEADALGGRAGRRGDLDGTSDAAPEPTTDPGPADHVVLRNVSSRPVDLSGWFLRDDPGFRVSLRSGQTIPAGGTLAVYVGPGATDIESTAGPIIAREGSHVGLFNRARSSVALHRADGSLADVVSGEQRA
jgi:glycerophosphoryl diester phosphodiesterase